MPQTTMRLRSFNLGVRFGLTCLLLTMLGGFGASFKHLTNHHENRDEVEGLSVDDVRGAYHGVRTTAPLLAALTRDHPAELVEDANNLPDADRQVLLDWLASDRISEDFDNLDLGDAAPAEIISLFCLDCHERQSDDPIGQVIPLEYWDDVKAVAFSREINPTDEKILAASTHTHALTLSLIAIVLSLMLCCTRLPRAFTGIVIGFMGFALMADIAAWWLARSTIEYVWVIIGAGAVYNGLAVLSAVLIIVDLWFPNLRKKDDAD